MDCNLSHISEGKMFYFFRAWSLNFSRATPSATVTFRAGSAPG